MTANRRSTGFVGHAATYAVGNIARRVVGFAMLPIYTRFLTPADYGVVGLLTFAVSLFEPVFGARLGWAIPKFYFDATDERSRRTVIWGALLFTGTLSALSVLALIAFRGVASEVLFGDRKYALVVGLFAVTLLSQPIEQASMTYVRLKERSRLFLGFSMLKLLIQVALNLLLVVYWQEGVLGVVLSTVISSVLLGIVVTTYVAAQARPAFDWQVTRRMVQFCWPMWLSGIAGLYIGSSGAVYLRAFDTLSDVGRLELGLRFAAMTGMLIWAPFAKHWQPMSFQYYKEEGGERKFQVAFVVMSALMFAGGLGISIFSQPVIRLMAAKSFQAAAAVVPILTLGFVFNSLKSFFIFSFMATSHTKVRTICQYVTAAAITVAYVVLVPALGLLGAACAQCIGFVGSFMLVRTVSRRYYDAGISLAPIGVFTLIGFVAYLATNVVLVTPSLSMDLLVKSAGLAIAVALIGFIGVREIHRINGPSFANLPWPLNRLGRIPIGRQSAGS